MSMSDSPPDKIRDKSLVLIALILWGVMFVVGTAHVVRDIRYQNECLIYAQATSDWWAGRDMYLATWTGDYLHYDPAGIDSFLYFPHAAILYTPFALLGHPVGDVVWRFLGLSLFCHSLWLMSKLLSPNHALRVFALGSFVAMAPAYNSLHNAQVNLPLAAVMVYTTVALTQKRWWRAVGWLMLGLALKPIIFVMILLVGAVYRPMRWRLALPLAFFFLLPFATQNFHYVLSAYHQCRMKLSRASHPNRAFSDLRGLIWKLGWIIPFSLLAVFQVIAAAATLVLCFIATRRWKEPAMSAFVLMLTACYLMLFNPRTEGNSYVILAPVIALPAALLFLDPRRHLAAWVLVGIAFCLTGNLWAYRLTLHWLKPLACVVFVILMVRELLRKSIQDWPLVMPRGIEEAVVA
jgi:hypothetical protein